MEILVCLRPDPGPADWAALETSLRIAESSSAGSKVVAACVGVGPLAKNSEPNVLETALVVGASKATYLQLGGDQAIEPNSLAAANAPTFASAPPFANALTVARALESMAESVDLVICGHDLAREMSGAVPAFLAGLLGRPQILGALDFEVGPNGVTSICLGDQGRRATYSCALPAVISVVPGSVGLRRAALTSLVDSARIEVLRVSGRVTVRADRLGSQPPRTKLVEAPSSASPSDRVLALTKANEEQVSSRVVSCDPAEAASLAIEALSEWGYI